MGRAPSTAALVELDEPITGRIKPTTPIRTAAGARSAVQGERRLPYGTARDLPVDRMTVADIEHAGNVRLDWRIYRNNPKNIVEFVKPRPNLQQRTLMDRPKGR